MVKREIKGRYLLAFLLTASVFVLGIFLGVIMSDVKTSAIYGYERDLMTNFIFQDVQTDLLQSDPCNFVNSDLVSQGLFRVGDRLDALEKEKGSDDDQVKSLKAYYTILEVKDFLFFKKINKDCNASFVLNLFFYSNDPKVCDQCVDQGFVLSYARAKNENVRTYSFDVDMQLPVVQYLVSYYNVTNLPTVVFNEKIYQGFVDAEEVDEIISDLENG